MLDLSLVARALRYKNYRLFFVGQFVSMVGTWMTHAAAAWLVYRLTGSAWLLGVVGFASQFPAFLLSPLGGIVADRWDQRRLLVATQVALMVQSLALAALTLTGRVDIPAVIGFSVLQGVVSAFDMPCRQAFLVAVIESREDLGNAIALNSSLVHAARLVGAALGGLIIAAWGEGWCFLIDGGSFLAVIAALLAMDLAPQPRKAGGGAGALAELREGLSYAAGSAAIRSILLLLALVCLVGFPYTTLIPIFADRVLHGGPSVLGALMAASGLGALLGAVWLASRRSVAGLGGVIPLATGTFGAGLIAFSFSRALWLSIALMVLSGFGFMVQLAAGNTILQTIVDDDKRGRVMSFFMMAFFGAAPFGSLLAGRLADRIGAPHTLTIGGACCILGAIWFAGRPARWKFSCLSISFLIFPLISSPSRAAEAGRTLSWEECVAIAARNNPDLASSAKAEQASRASYYGSFNAFLPNLSLSNSYSDGSSFRGGEASRWSAQASASMNIFDAGQIAGIKSASAAFVKAKAELRAASAALRFNLRKAFAQLLFAQKNLEVSRLILDRRERGAQLVALRYDSGRESKGNMLRSRAQSAQARAELSQSLRDLRTARKSLDRQLGLDDFSVVVATGALEAGPPPELAEDVRPLLGSRPDIAVQEAAIQSAKAGLAEARSPVWPSLSATYTRTRTGREEFPSDRYSWSFGGLLSYPLFGGGPTATYFAASAAKRGLEKAEQDLRAAREQAVVELENAWSAFAGGVDQVQVRAALLEASRQRSDEADVRYASGLLSYDNWEIIASDRIDSERQSIRAALDAVVAMAAWEKALGKALGE